MNLLNLQRSPDAPAPTDATPAPDATPPTPAPDIDPQELDFSPSDNVNLKPIAPANGTHLCRLSGFEPAVDPDTGRVLRWVITLDAAEDIPDNQNPPSKIADGARIGTFSVFMSPSEYTKEEDCVATALRMSFALNEIVCDPRNDPDYKHAKEAWKVLPPVSKHPTFAGTPAMLPSRIEYYNQHVGKLVKVTFATKASKSTGQLNTRLTGFAAPKTPGALKK